MGLETDYEIPVLTTSAEFMIQWARRSAIWPVAFGLACSAIEMMATGASRHAKARLCAAVFPVAPPAGDSGLIAGPPARAGLHGRRGAPQALTPLARRAAAAVPTRVDLGRQLHGLALALRTLHLQA